MLVLNRIAFFLSFLYLFLATSCDRKKPGNDMDGKELIKTSVLSDNAPPVSGPLLLKRRAMIEKALSSELPLIFLEEAGREELSAQQLAVLDTLFTENMFEKGTGKPYLNEIFNVYKARPQEIPQGAAYGTIYRVEMYNFGLNLTTTALVDLTAQKVLAVNELVQTQPDIPLHLKDVALHIAVNSPEVIEALGFKPGESEALMPNTKTALNNTRCEESLHLCVAPTFVKDEKALWAIVDLTELRLVGVRWTHVGNAGPEKRISERNLRYDKIMECYCSQVNSVKKDEWQLNYILTSSDGMRISEVTHRGVPVISNAKIVDWHVSYSNTDGFGYSDAVGCPEFSQAAVLAVTEPRVVDIVEGGKTIGFALEQTFNSKQWPMPCNYNYLQRFEFYRDGRMRVAGASLGRGCGNNGTYRPVMRIALYGSGNTLYEWGESGWQPWKKEQWRLQESRTRYTPEGYQYKFSSPEGKGYYLEPGKGQFNDGGRGDNAYLFATRLHADRDEGESDLVSIGPCCNTDYRQGPEKFIEPDPEDIENQALVLWYVPQIKNDDRKGSEYCWAESYLENGIYKTRSFPCMSGPMFVPIGNQEPIAFKEAK
ncbi:MAG: hypothetical protein ABS46_03470 [Cytophagaceae bacterium SCN 52-12]|nr:MAG: hypothetical protein ABS46_03470 [Cytophagaceae bacterium SCN 52-12]